MGCLCPSGTSSSSALRARPSASTADRSRTSTLQSSARSPPARRFERAGLTTGDIDEVLIGHGRQARLRPQPARQVGHRAGIPHSAPAQTINKACASGLQAIVSAAQSIMLGESDIALAGGIESMSRMPYLIDAADARWGHRMGNFTLVDAMYRDGFSCPLSNLIMGETAEVLARQYGITREQSDCFALESQRKAQTAIAAGHFAREIAPVALRRPRTARRLADQRRWSIATSILDDTTIESLRKLPPVFGEVEGHPGIITAGTSSGITDGGAAWSSSPHRKSRAHVA